MTLESNHQGYPYELVPASQFSVETLADIYNAARADYLVPMQTDTQSLQKYIHLYDVDLDASVVILDREGRLAGLNMLGVRGDRGWITRLGIIQARRQGGMGMEMMQALMDAARKRNIRRIQLEVIEGNEAAHRLFIGCGFQEIRRLMVIQRLPRVLAEEIPTRVKIKPMSQDEIWVCLAQREASESWINENASLANVKNLEGLRLTFESGYSGWVIYERQDKSISHVVLQTDPPANEQVMMTLLGQLADLYGDHEINIENVPVGEIMEMTLQQFNYSEKFRRIEMFLNL
jgi:ribosomal protein S18 acetylase RimI-like enzyme